MASIGGMIDLTDSDREFIQSASREELRERFALCFSRRESAIAHAIAVELIARARKEQEERNGRSPLR